MRLSDYVRRAFWRPPPPAGIRAVRLVDRPIVEPGMLGAAWGANVNGPSLIRVPDWVPGRLGRYYLYFGSHLNGRSIGLAYADTLTGPWRVHAPGSLRLADAPGVALYMSAPDVHVDETARQVRMYFHGGSLADRAPRTFLAQSSDGIDFTGRPEPLAGFYFRGLPWRDGWIGMSKGGVTYRSPDGLARFARNRRPAFPMHHPMGNRPGDVRHVALRARGDILDVYFTRIGDRPEQILHSTIDLLAAQWIATPPRSVLRPEFAWEGADLPVTVSRPGPSRAREHALRDPALYAEDGRLYLLYSVAGEAGIAIAELIDPAEA